jgi:hypothetical protein
MPENTGRYESEWTLNPKVVGSIPTGGIRAPRISGRFGGRTVRPVSAIARWIQGAWLLESALRPYSTVGSPNRERRLTLPVGVQPSRS